eukprot:g11706.t1
MDRSTLRSIAERCNVMGQIALDYAAIRRWHQERGYLGAIVVRQLDYDAKRAAIEDVASGEKSYWSQLFFDNLLKLANDVYEVLVLRVLGGAFRYFSDYRESEANRRECMERPDECYYLYYEICGRSGERTYEIFLRGTMVWSDWLENLNFRKVYDAELDCYLHAGFLRKSLRLLDDLEPLLTDKEGWISLHGHSLGGAMGMIMGLKLRKRGFKVRQVTTFGAPKFVTSWIGGGGGAGRHQMIRSSGGPSRIFTDVDEVLHDPRRVIGGSLEVDEERTIGMNNLVQEQEVVETQFITVTLPKDPVPFFPIEGPSSYYLKGGYVPFGKQVILEETSFCEDEDSEPREEKIFEKMEGFSVVLSDGKLRRFATAYSPYNGRAIKPSRVPTYEQTSTKSLLVRAEYDNESANLVIGLLRAQMRAIAHENNVRIDVDEDIPDDVDGCSTSGGSAGINARMQHWEIFFGAGGGGAANEEQADQAARRIQQQSIAEARMFLLRRRREEAAGIERANVELDEDMDQAAQARSRPAGGPTDQDLRSVIHLANLIEYGTGTRRIWREENDRRELIAHENVRFRISADVSVGDRTVNGAAAGGCFGCLAGWAAAACSSCAAESSGGAAGAVAGGGAAGGTSTPCSLALSAKQSLLLCLSAAPHISLVPAGVLGFLGAFYGAVFGYLSDVIANETVRNGGTGYEEYGCGLFVADFLDALRNPTGRGLTDRDRIFGKSATRDARQKCGDILTGPASDFLGRTSPGVTYDLPMSLVSRWKGTKFGKAARPTNKNVVYPVSSNDLACAGAKNGANVVKGSGSAEFYARESPGLVYHPVDKFVRKTVTRHWTMGAKTDVIIGAKSAKNCVDPHHGAPTRPSTPGGGAYLTKIQRGLGKQIDLKSAPVYKISSCSRANRNVAGCMITREDRGPLARFDGMRLPHNNKIPASFVGRRWGS